jgi:hypothetical protein
MKECLLKGEYIITGEQLTEVFENACWGRTNFQKFADKLRPYANKREMLICPNYENCSVDGCYHSHPHAQVNGCKMFEDCPQCEKESK